eukprot:scaffold211332_cov13-Tisochrysis_lutea.AAC.1
MSLALMPTYTRLSSSLPGAGPGRGACTMRVALWKLDDSVWTWICEQERRRDACGFVEIGMQRVDLDLQAGALAPCLRGVASRGACTIHVALWKSEGSLWTWICKSGKHQPSWTSGPQPALDYCGTLDANHGSQVFPA